MSEAVYVFIAHGAGEQWTLRENRRAFDDFVFTPHRMRWRRPRGPRSRGRCCASRALRRAAWRRSRRRRPDRSGSREILERTRAAGFKTIILTVDAIGQDSSDEYVRLGRARPWLPYGNFPIGSANAFKTDLSWADVEFTRNVSGLPVVVKGITRPDNAVAAVKAGASAIQVSNHGGRALDGTPAAITVLPQIADAMKGSAPIIMDSGIRQGMDVAKALALGANAVVVGRPVWWALAIAGPGGVAALMEYFHRELVNTMLHCGVDRITALGPSHVRRLERRPA